MDVSDSPGGLSPGFLSPGQPATGGQAQEVVAARLRGPAALDNLTGA